MLLPALKYRAAFQHHHRSTRSRHAAQPTANTPLCSAYCSRYPNASRRRFFLSLQESMVHIVPKERKRRANLSSRLTKKQGYINGSVPPPPLHLCILPLDRWLSFFFLFSFGKIFFEVFHTQLSPVCPFLSLPVLFCPFQSPS